MKKYGFLFLLFLAGCTNSTPEVAWNNPVSTMLFSNSTSNLTIYRTHIASISLTCDNFVSSLKIQVDGVEKTTSEVLENTSDLDCSDRNLGLVIKSSVLTLASNIKFYAIAPTGVSSPSEISVIDLITNQSPIAYAGAISILEDNAFSGMLSASDPEGDSLVYYISQPSKGVVTLVNPYTGAFTYTPNLNETGLDSFTFRVSDGFTSSSLETVSVSIDLVNDTPITTDTSIEAIEDTVQSGNLVATDVDSNNLTYSVVTQGTKGVVVITDGATGSFTYSPYSNTTGTDSFTFKVSDGSLDSNISTVSVSISSINDAPIAFEGTLTTNEESSQSVSLVGYDEEGSSLTYTVLSSPLKGTLSGTAPNFIFTPNNNENGTDEIVFQVNDGVSPSNIATVTINILPVNDAPIAENDSFNVVKNMTAGIILRSRDIEGDSLTYSIVSNPTNGVITGSGENWTYTPNAEYVGTDSFSFKVNDGVAYSNVAVITLTVALGANQNRVCTVIGNDGLTGGVGREFSTDSGSSWGSCIPQSCVYPYELVSGQCKVLTIQEKYPGMNYFMSHYERNLTGSCTSSDCIYVGDKKKVVTEDNSCSGLALKDSEELFIWDCVEESGVAVFYSRANLTRYKFLSRAIDLSGGTPQWKNIFVTLAGSSNSGTKSKSRTPWANSLAWAGANLNIGQTVYVIPSGFSSAIGIYANDIALVGKMIFNSNDYTLGVNNCLSNTDKCLIRSLTSKKNLYFEVDIVPQSSGSSDYLKEGIGIYLNSSKYSYIFNSSLSYFNKGIFIDGGLKNIIYRTQISNIKNEALLISGNNNIALKSSIVYSGVGIKSLSINNNFVNNTLLNNEIGVRFIGNENLISNSLIFGNNIGLQIESNNNLLGNLVLLNQEQANISTVGIPSNNKFLFKAIINNHSGNLCLSTNIAELSISCNSSTWDVENIAENNIDLEDFFEIDYVGSSLFENNEHNSFYSLWVPENVNLDHQGDYNFASSGSNSVGSGYLNYNNLKLSLNPTFSGGFRIKENNITSAVGSSSQVTSGVCPASVLNYYNHPTKKSLITASEIPWILGGNDNGICESNESCEYSSQYGSAQVLYPNRDKTLCEYTPKDGSAPVNIKLYPPQL